MVERHEGVVVYPFLIFPFFLPLVYFWSQDVIFLVLNRKFGWIFS